MTREYVICLGAQGFGPDTFVRVYKNNKTWTTRVWANTATKFATVEAARAWIASKGSGCFYTCMSVYGTDDKGKTIFPARGFSNDPAIKRRNGTWEPV